MNRRGFLLGAGALMAEPWTRKAYSFIWQRQYTNVRLITYDGHRWSTDNFAESDADRYFSVIHSVGARHGPSYTIAYSLGGERTYIVNGAVLW